MRAAGDYRSFVIEQRRTCALVRHLALRDRATTRDGVLKFLARTGERGLFRRVLSYLPPPPLQPTKTALYIRIVWVNDGEQHLFRVRPTKPLMRVFKDYATRKGLPVARLAFSLPDSEVLIEGCQTTREIGLEGSATHAADGEVINAMPYAEHPTVLRKQAAAAAVAAAAARQYLEDLEALRKRPCLWLARSWMKPSRA